MLRKLLVLTTGVVFTWLAALPASAQPVPSTPPAPTATATPGHGLRLGETTTFQIRGFEGQKGAYTGTLTLNLTSPRRAFATRSVTFSSTGSVEAHSGILQLRRNRFRGVLRYNAGLVGGIGGGATPRPIYIITSRNRQGLYSGITFSNVGRGTFGEIAPPPAPTTQTPSGETFDGRPIYDYDPAIGITDLDGAYRLAVDDDDNDAFDALATKFVQDPKLSQIKSLVIGYWGYDAAQAVPILVANKDKLQALESLFFGDIDQEEAEISWIQNSDLGPLVSKLPNLRLLKVRGGNGLGFSGAFKHEKLEKIVIESGGTPASAVRELAALDLPALEHLELWLGTDEYGGDSSVSDIMPFLDGAKLPKLKYLGLMNSDITDGIAQAAATAKIIDQLKTLDLSMGTLSDAGAQHILTSAKLKTLTNLYLSHHYMTDAVRDQVEALSPVNVSAGDSQLDPSYPDDRYVDVGE